MWTRRSFQAGSLAAAAALVTPSQVVAKRLPYTIVRFDHSPFPYDGLVPESGRPFLDTFANGQRGHTSPRGGVYLEDPTYSSQDVLLCAAPRVSSANAMMVVFLHGNLVKLKRDVVERQRIVTQYLKSGCDGVLVAPQFAVDALDSSAGHFWDADGFARFLDEAADKLATYTGADRARFVDLPIVLVAYSGGYNPAAAILSHTAADSRIAGLILMDALYGEQQTFADWLVQHNGRVFFFSAYSPSSAAGNLALAAELRSRGIAVEESLPTRLAPGTVASFATGPLAHNDFMTRAWTRDPLEDLLKRIEI
jgi:hypothetical protein